MIKRTEKFWIRLNGQSMSPLLLDQDEILIEPTTFEKIKCGDIVLFKDAASTELTVHRLVAFPFYTKGDYSLIGETNHVGCFLGLAIGYKRGDQFRKISEHSNLFLFFSKLRMKNYVVRKVGLMGLIVLATFFEFYSAKTKSDHTKVPR